MVDGERRPGDDRSSDEPRARGFLEDVARAIGRTAGRTKDALSRFGERGAIALAVRRLEHERSEGLEELGRIARKALAAPDGVLRADDPRVAELARTLDRLDEKLARMRERLSDLGKEASPEGGPHDGGEGVSDGDAGDTSAGAGDRGPEGPGAEDPGEE